MANPVSSGDDRREERRQQRELAQQRAAEREQQREIERQREEMAEELGEELDRDIDPRRDIVVDEDEGAVQAQSEIQVDLLEQEFGDDIYVGEAGASFIEPLPRDPAQRDVVEDALGGGYGTSPGRMIDGLDPDEVDEVRDSLDEPWQDFVTRERAEEAIEEREELQRLREEDPEEFVERVDFERAIQAQRDLIDESRREIEIGAAERGLQEDVAEELDVDRRDVRVDRAGSQLEVAGLTDAGRRQLEERQAQQIAQDAGVDVGREAVDVDFDSAGVDVDVDNELVRDKQIEEIRQQQAEQFGLEPDQIEAIETDDGFIFQPTGVVDGSEVDRDLLEELLGEDVETDDVDELDFTGDGAEVRFSSEAEVDRIREEIASQSPAIEPDEVHVRELSEEERAWQILRDRASIGPSEGDPGRFDVQIDPEAELEAFGDDIEADAASQMGLEPDQVFAEATPTGIQVRPDPEVEEEILTEQIAEEEGVDPDRIAIERDGDELGFQIEPEERETWAGRQLQRGSDWYQESVVDRAGGWVRDTVPGEEREFTLATTPTFAGDPVPITTEERPGDIGGGAVEGALGVLDVPGMALSAADAGSWGRDVWMGARESQADALSELREMDFEEFRDDPRRTAALSLEAGTGAGYLGGRARAGGEEALLATGDAMTSIIADDGDFQPIEESARLGAGIGTGVGGPTAAIRGGRTVQSWDLGPRGRTLRGDDRAQMDITIQRDRQRDLPDEAFEPADPTAPTPEGRAPPREAFPDEQAWRDAVRRREEQIMREQAERPDVEIDPSASPAERVRQQRELFDDWDEYQRELQRARELEQRQQLAERSDTVAAFGDPSELGMAEADAFVDPSQDQDLTAGFADPSDGMESMESDVFPEPATDELATEMGITAPEPDQTVAVDTELDPDIDVDAGGLFADPTVDQTLATEDQLTQGLAADQPFRQPFAQPFAQPTAMAQPMAERLGTRQALATDQMMAQRPMQAQRFASPTPRPTRLTPRAPWPDSDPEPTDDPGFGLEFDDAGWDTGFADVEDVWWGDEDDDEEDDDWGWW